MNTTRAKTKSRLARSARALSTIAAIRDAGDDQTIGTMIVARIVGRELAVLAAEWITSPDLEEKALALGVVAVNERMRAGE
jgi:hypothetical protein